MDVCFICKKEKKRNGLFTLHGSRARDSLLSDKLGYFFEDELIRNVRRCKDELLLCHVCENTIDTCYNFIQQCHVVFKEVVSRKRTAPTPLHLRVTPQKVAPLKSRKSLDYCVAGEGESVSQPPKGVLVSEGAVAPLPDTPPQHFVTVALPPQYEDLEPQSESAVAIEKMGKVIQTVVNSGLYFRNIYVTNPQIKSDVKTSLKDSVDKFHNYDDLVREVLKIDSVQNAVKKRILLDLDKECQVLCGKRNSSVLTKNAPIGKLKDGDIANLCLEEINNRLPFLLDVLVTVMCGVNMPEPSLLGPVTMAYSIMMNKRNSKLSAYQRMLTLIFARYGLKERGIATTSKLGVSLTNRSKLNLMDECAEETAVRVKEQMSKSSLYNIVGDNCDIRISPNIQTTAHSVQDCHYFSSLVFFPRININEVKMLSSQPVEEICATGFILNENERNLLFEGYKFVLGHLLAKNMTAFKWMKAVLPKTLSHEYEEYSKKRTIVMPLQLILRNEAKYEDCVVILRETQDLLKKYRSQDVNPSEDGTFHLYFGDQLTRVRLQGAQALLSQAPTPEGRIQEIGPFITAPWHIKQDFIHKAYKRFFKRSTAADRGTLYNFKILLKQSYVNGNVKSNFAAHSRLFLEVGECLLMEQVLEYMGMDSYESCPDNIPKDVDQFSEEDKKSLFDKLLLEFLNHYQYGQFALDTPIVSRINPPEPDNLKMTFVKIGKSKTGQDLMGHKVKPAKPDEIMAHGTNFTQWALQLMLMNEIAHAADIEKFRVATKYNIPFFYSHSTLSKYFIECVDYVLKTEHKYSPPVVMRILDGTFINAKGGTGKNVETDLAQEHSIRSRKELIKSLGANKSEGAIVRVTSAADTVAATTGNFARSIGVPSASGHHTSTISDEDRNTIKEILREQRPFQYTSGRKFKKSNLNLPWSPFTSIDRAKMLLAIERNAKRLSRGLHVDCDQEPDEDTEQYGLPDVDSDIEEFFC